MEDQIDDCMKKVEEWPVDRCVQRGVTLLNVQIAPHQTKADFNRKSKTETLLKLSIPNKEKFESKDYYP
jgi:hypothetical protein